MRDVNEALAAVAAAVRQPRLEPDGDGWIGLDLEGQVTLWLRVLEDEEAGGIEASARVPGAGAEPREDEMRGMLLWNHANAPMRLSVEPGRGPMVGRRIDVRAHDAAGLRTVLGEVAVAAARLGEDGLPRARRVVQRAPDGGEEVILRL